MSLTERIVAIHRALRAAGVPHAFGGALALAWCTQQARGTIDIDVNIFVDVDQVRATLAVLPAGIVWTDDDLALLERDGQARLWWDRTPIDLFFNTTDFHLSAGDRARVEPFEGEEVPFLACRDLAVFKAFFNRTKDWADLEAMADAGALDVEAVLGVLAHYLGADDERLERLRALAS
jgi:hypothetical protein